MHQPAPSFPLLIRNLLPISFDTLLRYRSIVPLGTREQLAVTRENSRTRRIPESCKTILFSQREHEHLPFGSREIRYEKYVDGVHLRTRAEKWSGSRRKISPVVPRVFRSSRGNCSSHMLGGEVEARPPKRYSLLEEGSGFDSFDYA